jgi:hypothetical protein
MNKVRATTGRPDTSQLTDAKLTDYINKYYQQVMPKELKTFFGYTYYTFFAYPGIAQYTIPTDPDGDFTDGTTSFSTLNPQVWVGGFPADWYLDPDTFFQDYPMQENTFPVGSGDGSTLTFTFVIPSYPILPGSLYVNDGGTQTATDNGNGGFNSPYTGTVDYLTGSVSITFVTAPALNNTITATCQQYIPSRPQGVLFFSGTLTLRSVPDAVYLVKLQGNTIPTALVNSTDIPYRPDMGPLIAFGASLEIFSDFNQMDQYQQYLPQYNRYKDISMQDTYEEDLYVRSIPKF